MAPLLADPALGAPQPLLWQLGVLSQSTVGLLNQIRGHWGWRDLKAHLGPWAETSHYPSWPQALPNLALGTSRDGTSRISLVKEPVECSLSINREETESFNLFCVSKLLWPSLEASSHSEMPRLSAQVPVLAWAGCSHLPQAGILAWRNSHPPLALETWVV